MRRPERLAVTLREEIGEIVGFELEDPRVERATVTDVSVSDDLRDASVYVLVDGEEAEIETAMLALKNAVGFVRRQVALNLNLHHAPQLHFIRDVTEERATRIEKLLEELPETKDN